MKKMLYVSAFILLSFLIGHHNLLASEASKVQYRLLLSTADYPVSLDPLDADLTNNMDLMKMRYFTPIEVDHEDKFRSSVLEKFEYDPKSFTMTWKVRNNLKYADGTPLAPSDIILAIKRMALKRSGFPVLNSVKGLKEWSYHKNALSQEIPGIKLADNTITLLFDRNVNNPFFQFSLAIFAIQPSRCFDLNTSKLICDNPPASGYYDYAGSPPKLDPKDGKYPPIPLKLRKGFEQSGTFKMPPEITLEYPKVKGLPDLVEILDDRSVARTEDSRLTDKFINQFRDKIEIKRLPKTAIDYLLINPTFEAFKDKTCRRIFANKYRSIYQERTKKVTDVPKSFSSPMMPGYLSNEGLEKLVPTADSNSCLETFKKYPIKYKRTYPFWDKILEGTMNAVGMPTSGIYDGDKSKASFWTDFENNNTAIMSAYVNFWPLDLPSGFNMFFTPEMHSQLKYLLKDGKLTELSDKLFRESDPKFAKDYFEKINILLYEEAQLNALSYFGNVYLSKASKVNRLPIATSEPNPWHLFMVK